VERNDVEEVVLNKFDEDDGLEKELSKLDDERRLDCLLGFVPDKSELVVLSFVDEDNRLEL